MAYVASKGGEAAIEAAERFYRSLCEEPNPQTVRALETSIPFLLDRIIGESSLYAPELAALALSQTAGDLNEAVLLLRAYRSTLPRIGYAQTLDESMHLVVRRISAAFKDIPGGQLLGPSLDYSHRLLNMEALSGYSQEEEDDDSWLAEKPCPSTLPLVTSWEKKQGLIPETIKDSQEVDARKIPDLTREPMLIPAPRAHRLQALSRADTGGVLTLGYANMRGYGGVHPTVNELRLSHASVRMVHPVTGQSFDIGRFRMSQAEVVSTFSEKQKDGYLDLGYCATMGWNEVKVIAGSMLDMAMDLEEPHPSHTEEYVLYHTEVVESSGFCIHYKLPHYVTFNSTLDNLRAVRESSGPAGENIFHESKPASTQPQSERANHQSTRDLADILNETGLPTKTIE